MRHLLRTVLQVSLVSTSILYAACGGSTPTEADDPPSLGAIGAQTTDEGVTVDVSVTIIDEVPSSVTLSASATNAVLVPAGGFVFSGTGTIRTLAVTPAAGQSGSTTVTVTATDAASQTGSTTFGLTVDPGVLNAPPTLAAITDQTTAEDTPFDVTVDITDETPATVTLGASSTNATLVPPSGLVFSGSGASRTLTVTPATSQSGMTVITVIATDAGSLADTIQFDVTVTAPSGPDFMWSEILEPGDGVDQRYFGSAIRVSGDIIAISAEGGSPDGKVYVFRNNAGAITEEWSTSRPGNGFATYIGLDGDYLATYSTSRTRIFARTTPAADNWIQEDSIDVFGPVALSAERLVLANFAQDVKVYTRSSGVWTNAPVTLDPGALASDDEYGRAVALDGDVAVIAAAADDDLGIDAGAVYVFRYSGTWGFEQKLTATDGQAGDSFGYSVAVEGDRIVVGATRVDDDGTDSGAVYVFERVGAVWGEVAKLTPGASSTGAAFGRSLDLSGGEIVVGAPGAFAGRATHFTATGASWTPAPLPGAGIVNGDQYGSAVAIQGDEAYVGAMWDNTLQGLRSGSVHVFVR